MDLNKLLTDISTVAHLLREQLDEVKRLRADMDMMRAEHKQMDEVVQNHVATMQNFADMAFDDNKFTQELLSRCEEAAAEAAKDAIDIDDIASEVSNNIDVSEDVERCAERLGYVCDDKVRDLVEEYVNDNNLLNTDEVEEVVEEYIERNCDFVEKDVTDQLHEDIVELREEMQEMKQEIIDTVIQVLINKLTAKENDHATNYRSDSVQVSGTNGQGQANGHVQIST